jgi:hypothetical protein
VRQSAQECLGKLRATFGDKLIAGFGDHDLGKLSLFGARGGMRLASWRRAIDELGLRPFWKLELGNYVLLGVVSSLIALPVFAPDVLPEERSEWKPFARSTSRKSARPSPCFSRNNACCFSATTRPRCRFCGAMMSCAAN